jgi:acyl-CoA dehydrogenase
MRDLRPSPINIFGLNPVVVLERRPKRRWLPALSTGVTRHLRRDRNTGLDTTRLKTRAVWDGKHYVVNGRRPGPRRRNRRTRCF